MRIEDLRYKKKNDRSRVTATVTWEDCDRAAHDVFFEVDEKFSESLSCDPHAFLIGCAIPALHYGEKRVFVEGKICPELKNGLNAAMMWLCLWFYDNGRQPVRIEAELRSGLSHTPRPERAASFFSGGIDSFSTLLTNRMYYPLDHPRSIRDSLVVFGLEQDDPDIFTYVLESLNKVAGAANTTLIPVYTNIYQNYRKEDAACKWRFWAREFQAAALSAVAHALSRRLTLVSIAASDSLPNNATINRKHISPLGSHPVLDPNYSSIDLRIRHDGLTLSRLAKTRIVADWEPALQNLRVCNHYKSYKRGLLNCGRCEKCLRTMLALEALGVLDKTEVFQTKDIRAALHLQKTLSPYYYMELLPLLRDRGLDDLVKIIERKITLYRRQKMIDFSREKIKELAANVFARHKNRNERGRSASLSL